MESYTDMKYSDCGCSGRCRKVSGNRNQSVRSCLDPAMQAGSGVRYPQMGNQMNDGMPQMIPETGNNWENNGNFGWNRMPGLEGNAFCPGSMPGMKDRINRAGATAAALAGLHPQDYDEDHKVSGSLGLGFYHGTQALAVGLFVRPTENLMFNIGGAFASNDHMLNLGVSYRFGDNSMEKKSPQQLQEEVTSLKTENTDLSARLATANARIDSQASELKALKAQIADIQKHLH